MAKRGYKLHEFMAHSGNVNCLSLAKKRRGLFITGGDDQVVNLWSIGQPTALMSLCGHTSPVESVAFDSKEAFVVAGASAGGIKLWDLDEIKMVRSLHGHRSYCTAVEFHPFGEFFASGSKDTNLKIWDIRKKECIHTYKGHTRGINTVRFTPDGRWVVSGGFDNVVKIWDLTAGKLLHDFKLHEGHIRSIDFHPIEFLLATGSADRTVKFWDLETFELIGSSRPESTGVRSITFHPEGKTLFSGLDDSLKVYSWEPVICHDSVDMGWATLGDLCIQDGKLLGGSYYQNFVGVWVTDISLIERYRESSVPEPNSNHEQGHDLKEISLQKVGSYRRSSSSSSLRCISSDDETKEIKNIYVDTSGGHPVTSRKISSIKSSKIVSSSNAMEINKSPTKGQVPAVGLHVESIGHDIDKSFIVPSVVPQDSSDGKDISRRESSANGQIGVVMPVKPSHIRRLSNTALDIKRLGTSIESLSLENMKGALDRTKDSSIRRRVVGDDARESSDGDVTINNVEKTEELLSSRKPSDQENCNESLNGSKGVKAVKYVNGVAVVRGRTRSLVERFEKREKTDELLTPSTPQMVPETTKILVDPARQIIPDTAKTFYPPPRAMPDTMKAAYSSPPPLTPSTPQMVPETTKILVDAPQVIPDTAKTFDPPPRAVPDSMKAAYSSPRISPDTKSQKIPDTANSFDPAPRVVPDTKKASYSTSRTSPETAKRLINSPRIIPDAVKAFDQQPRIVSNTRKASYSTPQIIRATTKTLVDAPQIPETVEVFDLLPEVASPDTMNALTTIDDFSKSHSAPHLIHETLEDSPMSSRPQMTRRGPLIQNDDIVTEDLMKNHDVFLSTLRSRLTKLQVVRHFLERKDIKGAINAMQKLPDHAVQVELISVLMGKMEILTLDLFLSLLPVLLGLLDSKAERHVNISLEMLVKLVAVFGPVVHSAISAPRAVGVDLQAEKRLECCNKCNILLQKIQKTLPALIRRGGLLAKCAQELTLVMQD